MAEARQAYRFLLRTVRDRISSRKENPIWHDYIVEEFHRTAKETDPLKVQKLLHLAKDYAHLVQDVHYEKVCAGVLATYSLEVLKLILLPGQAGWSSTTQVTCLDSTILFADLCRPFPSPTLASERCLLLRSSCCHTTLA